MCIVAMLTGEESSAHEHPCEHLCECEIPDAINCDRCAIALTFIRRHPSAQLSIGKALACLYLSLHQLATEATSHGST